MDSLKLQCGNIVLDPNKTVILMPPTCEIKELTPEEKKLESLRNARDKYDEKYCDFILYALVTLIAVLANSLIQGVSLIFKYPILILIYLSMPFGVYLIGVIFILYSKYLNRKINKLMED